MWQLPQLLIITLQTKDGDFIEYSLAVALTIIPEYSCNLDPVSIFVQLRNALTPVGLKVFSVGNIVGCAHVIQEIAASSKTGDGRNEPWIVNRHIYLATCNTIYI